MHLNRRSLLKQLSLAPLLLRPSALSGLALRPAAESGPLQFHDVRYTPHYPVRSPLEEVLRLVEPGLDEFPMERDAAALEALLAGWAEQLKAGRLEALPGAIPARLQASPLVPRHEDKLRGSHGIESFRSSFSPAQTMSNTALVDSMRQWLGTGAQVLQAEFQITALAAAAEPDRARTASVRYSLTTQNPDASREQRVGTWQLTWDREPGTTSTAAWTLSRLEARSGLRTVLRGTGFIDVTEAALGANASYTQQLHNGSDYWRTVLDAASGIDVYGNNGVAVGDFDNSGFDSFYVAQPAGLPNRLYRNRGDGTLEDVTGRAGVGVLDNTACALFADFRNAGLQDLLVVCGSGPLLFLNQGDGTFRLKQDAFRFAKPPQGTFTHAAVADFDRDGHLDIYFCLYSYYLGLDQYHYPAPYFDARNGPSNFLMRNQGDASFTDHTATAGLDAENDRYSFACAWNDNGGKQPDLYVVNDFGRNNLYRGKGDGTFEAVSAAAHVQDVGAGMSACWDDYDNSGRAGLYVANMWSAAGQRVSHLPAFHSGSSAATRELYQRHAQGNALYRAEPRGAFTNVGEQAGVEMGRWAWGSDFFDFDRDGHPDLYIANGYITAPQGTAQPSPDLGSFFWRQVVARSPDDATPSPAYEHGWNALNELIRTDSSWSGRERNVLLASNGDGTFAEVSGPLGLDFLEDGRSFALADLDGDGRLEIILKNRNGPQLRILHNRMEQLGDGIAFRLRGTTSNRDAIGTVLTLRCGLLTQTRSLQAGSGFLSQHTKELFFGLGNGTKPISVTVRWPSGLMQEHTGLQRNSRVQLTEGEPNFKTTPFAATAYLAPAPTSPNPSKSTGAEETIPTAFGTWLLDPLKAPAFRLPDSLGKPVALESFRGNPVLLHFWSLDQPAWRPATLDAIPAQTLTVLLLNVDDPARQVGMTRPSLRHPLLLATPEVAGIYNLIFRYLFDRRANLPLPASFLIDAGGMIVKVYQGPVLPQDLLADLRHLAATPAERTRLALPFPGTLYQGSFERNDFTYGVAMFQHGYLDQAADSFAQVIAKRPDDAEAYYNLGTLNLRRNDYVQANRQLRKTLELKPNYPEAWNNLGMIAAQQNHTKDAAESFKRSLALRPDYATALVNLGNLYRHERSFAEARTYLSRALALGPDDPETNYSLGMLYAQQSQFAAAEDYLNKAIALRPGYPEALNNLAVLSVRQGENGKAEEQLLTCIRLNPAYEVTYLNLARLYLSEGERAKARKAVEDLLRLNPSSTAGKQAMDALGPAGRAP